MIYSSNITHLPAHNDLPEVWQVDFRREDGGHSGSLLFASRHTANLAAADITAELRRRSLNSLARPSIGAHSP